MIRRIDSVEAGQVFGLMGDVYANHSFLEQGLDAYQEQLGTGEYISLGDFDDDGLLQAHAGFRTHPDFVLINSLVVDPSKRGAGLGRKIFDARLDYIRDNHSVDFVVGYSMMQHLWSQKLYSDDFKPIGLDIGYGDIYHQDDERYNQGEASNAEIVLCQHISSGEYTTDISVPSEHQSFARKILDKVDVVAGFAEGPGELTDTETFLGFHPDVKKGLFVPAYLGRAAVVDFSPLLTSNDERRIFVDTIKEGYERKTSS
jgi:GNAT superfamily N-acetyltransferase